MLAPAHGRRIGLALALLAAICSRGMTAQAAGSDPAKAEELIRQANDLRRQGHDERALPLFRQAYEAAHSARTAGQLGLAEMALGYWVSAEAHLNEALAEPRNPWVGKNRAALESALRETQSHLADLRIEGKPDGAEITVNGTVAGTLPLASPVRVNEGQVSVEARAPRHKPSSMTISVAARANQRVQIALEAEEAPPPPQPTARVVTPSSVAEPTPENASERPGRMAENSSRPDAEAATDLPAWRRVLPWALLGGAVVAGGVGIWQQVSSQHAQSDFDAIPACGAGLSMRGSDARCQGLYDDFQSRKTHAFIGYGVAGVLGAGAVTLFIVNAASTPSTSTASTSPTLTLTPTGTFLTYAGHF